MKVSMLLILISFTLAAIAQDKEPVRFTFNHMSLSVTDLDRSGAFYTSVLRLKEITDKGKTAGVRWFSIGDDKELHLISIVKEPVKTNKAVHLVLTTPNFEAFIKDLDRLKIEYSDWPGTKGKINVRADGVNQIFLQDPDGYWIEVNSAAKD